MVKRALITPDMYLATRVYLIERVRRVDQNNLSIEGTVEDPKSHAMTWTGNTTAILQPGRIIREDLACGGVMNGD